MNNATESRSRAISIACSMMCSVMGFYLTASPVLAQDYIWQVESSLTYDVGKYGTGEETTYIYLPVTLKRFLSKGDVALSVPFVDMDTDGTVLIVDGAVLQGSGTGGSGLGDISLKGRYYWIEQNDRLPFIDLFTRLKLPTADEAEGLGTGEADLGFGVEFSRRLERNFISFAGLTYTFIGDPPNLGFDNRIDADIGLGKQINSKWMGSISYDYRSSISSGGTDAHSVSFIANCKVSQQLRPYYMVELGLSDGAADYGITAGLSYRF